MRRYIKYYMICAVILALAILIGPEHKANAATRKTLDVGKGDVTITKSGDYNLIGTTDKNKVTIEKGVKANIWMKNVTIEEHDYCERISFDIQEKANVNLILIGTNVITSNLWTDGYYQKDRSLDAIKVGKDARLSISKYSTGSLELHANGYASGIGGEGKIVINGGTINAYGGAYGAGIGNAVNPSAITVEINGGMVFSYGGIGDHVVDSWVYQYLYRDNTDVKIKDISASKITITGGMVIANSTSVQPVNKAGKALKIQYLNCNKGKLKKVIANNTTYGCDGINSKGFLAIWTTDKISKLELTFINGKKQTITDQDYKSFGDDIYYNTVFDIGNGSLLFLDHVLIYNNHVYRLEYQSTITIVGTTTSNNIIVEGEANLLFDSISVTMDDNSHNPFLIVGNHANASIELVGKNTFTTATPKSKSVMLVGNHATLCIKEQKPGNKMMFNLCDQSMGIYTECGSIEQYGGNIAIDTKKDAIGFYIGNGGSFTLYHGEFVSDSKEGKAIHVQANGTVRICGGSMSANMIGYYDDSNEENSDRSTFMMFGGKVTISGRMMFGKFLIYDGELNCHLLGSGSGSRFFQYGGNVAIDRYITDFFFGYEYGEKDYELDEKTKRIKGSAIEEEYLYGGTYTESGNVTEDDMKSVSFGRC